MIRYDGEVVYSESGSGIKATSRLIFNETQVTAIKSIARDEFKQQTDFGVVYVVKDMKLDDYGKLELIKVLIKHTTNPQNTPIIRGFLIILINTSLIDTFEFSS